MSGSTVPIWCVPSRYGYEREGKRRSLRRDGRLCRLLPVCRLPAFPFAEGFAFMSRSRVYTSCHAPLSSCDVINWAQAHAQTARFIFLCFTIRFAPSPSCTLVRCAVFVRWKNSPTNCITFLSPTSPPPNFLFDGNGPSRRSCFPTRCASFIEKIDELIS